MAETMSIEELLNFNYSNIQDLDELAKAIYAYKYSMENISVEIKQLSHIRDRNQNEHEAVIKKMQSMQEQNLAKTKSFKLKIEAGDLQFEKQVNEITQNNDKLNRQTELKHQQILGAFKKEIQDLRETESIVQENEKDQIEYLANIRQKSADLIEMQYAHHDNMNKEELLEQEENRNLFLKNFELIKQLKKNVKVYAGTIAYEQKQLNEEKNYELKAKLLELQEQIRKLRIERNSILKTKNENKINISLNEEELEEYKVVGSIQKSKIKMYNDKIQNMKKTMATEVGKWQNKINDKKRSWENQMKSSKLKLFNLEKEKEQLKINLEKYRVLGQTILLQRQQVQDFFLMAIEACKRDMSEFQGMQENVGKHYGQKVDIDELLPKDRHRILTNLYTKLALSSNK